VFAKEFRDRWAKGGVERYELVSRMGMSSSLMGLGALMYMNGNFVASATPKESRGYQEAQLLEGSIRTDEGTQVAIGRLQPVMSLIMLGADLAKLTTAVYDHFTKDEERAQFEHDIDGVLTKAMVLSTKWLTASVSLQSINEAIRILGGGDVNWSEWAGRRVKSVMPLSSVFGYLKYGDDTARQIYSLSDGVYGAYNRFALLPKRHPITGKPMPEDTMMGVTIRSDEKQSDVMDELLKTGAWIGRPDRKIKLGQLEHELTPEQYDAFLSKMAELPVEEDLAKLIGSQNYQKLGDADKLKANALSKVVSAYRTAAQGKFRMEPAEGQAVLKLLQGQGADLKEIVRSGGTVKKKGVVS